MKSKRYTMEWEELDGGTDCGITLATRVLEDLELPGLEEIVIGQFTPGYDSSENIKQIISTLIENKDKLQHIKSFFFGDMEYDECEVSWIEQGDYTNLYAAFPNLESLTIKGGGIRLGNLSHPNLKELIIITGGLPVGVLHSIANASLPNLERLFVYLGAEEYGCDASIEDVLPLLNPALFPNLKHLGLVDSEFQNEIVQAVMESDLPQKLETLSFCYGTLTDSGAQYLLDHVDKLKNLKDLDLQYNYLSDAMAEKLKALPFDVNVDDRQEADEDDDDTYYYVMLGE